MRKFKSQTQNSIIYNYDFFATELDEGKGNGADDIVLSNIFCTKLPPTPQFGESAEK